MAEEALAEVPERPVRVKITQSDGSWSKATLSRIPHESELQQGEKLEVLDDEAASDVYGAPFAPEYSEPDDTPAEQIASPAQPAKKAASTKEADK